MLIGAVNRNNSLVSEKSPVVRQGTCVDNRPQMESIGNVYYPPIKNITFGARPPHLPQDIRGFFKTLGSLNSKVWQEGKPVLNPEVPDVLLFMDDLTSYEKKMFVSEYRALTNFPDYSGVRRTMEAEVVSSISKLENEDVFGDGKDFKTMYVGYNKSCSVGKNMALPGSDIDGMVAVVDMEANDLRNQSFRYLWGQRTNQLLVQTPADHFPEVIPLAQVKSFVERADKAFAKHNFSKDELMVFSAAIDKFNPDYVQGADFNSRIIADIEMSEEEMSKYRHINSPLDAKKQFRYDFLATCMFLENYRQKAPNTLLDRFDEPTGRLFENSCLYKYSNITQQKALADMTKDKLLERQARLKDFDSWPDTEQFDFIKDSICMAFSRKPNQESSFGKMFSNEGSRTIGLDSLVAMYNHLVQI